MSNYMCPNVCIKFSSFTLYNNILNIKYYAILITFGLDLKYTGRYFLSLQIKITALIIEAKPVFDVFEEFDVFLHKNVGVLVENYEKRACLLLHESVTVTYLDM